MRYFCWRFFFYKQRTLSPQSSSVDCVIVPSAPVGEKNESSSSSVFRFFGLKVKHSNFLFFDCGFFFRLFFDHWKRNKRSLFFFEKFSPFIKQILEKSNTKINHLKVICVCKFSNLSGSEILKNIFYGLFLSFVQICKDFTKGEEKKFFSEKQFFICDDFSS